GGATRMQSARGVRANVAIAGRATAAPEKGAVACLEAAGGSCLCSYWSRARPRGGAKPKLPRGKPADAVDGRSLEFQSGFGFVFRHSRAANWSSERTHIVRSADNLVLRSNGGLTIESQSRRLHAFRRQLNQHVGHGDESAADEQ